MQTAAPPAILRMFRGDATQHYPVKQATWGFSMDKRYSVPILSFAVETERQNSVFPEDGGWHHNPRWGIDVWLPGLHAELLQPGCGFSIPSCYDDYTGEVYTNFHYDEHEGTEDNFIKVADLSNDLLLVSIEGYIRHEHASMRPTKITVDGEFRKLTPHPPINAMFGGRESLPPHDPPIGAIYHPPSKK